MAGTLEYQVYPEEYFSGCDVSVYFGDAWIDEIVSINFALMEYVQPVFIITAAFMMLLLADQDYF